MTNTLSFCNKTRLEQFTQYLPPQTTLPAPAGLAPDEIWEQECINKFQSERDEVLPRIEPTPGGNIMDFLRSLIDEEEEIQQVPKKKSRKQRRGRNKQKKAHPDDCVRAQPEEFDFEAELASLVMDIENPPRNYEEGEREREGEDEGEGEGELEIPYGGHFEEEKEVAERPYQPQEANEIDTERHSLGNKEEGAMNEIGSKEGDTALELEAAQVEINVKDSQSQDLPELYENHQDKTRHAEDTHSDVTDGDLQEIINRKKQELMILLAEGDYNSRTKRKREETKDKGEDNEHTEAKEIESGDEPDEDTETDGSKNIRKKRKKNKNRVFPHWKDEQSWKVVCYGTEAQPATPPTAELMKSIDAITSITLISYHVNWLGEEDVMPHHSNWLYHLLLKVEEPILRDTVADLRELRYKCSQTRSKIESPENPNLPLLNAVITLITKYFKVLEG